MQYWWIDWLATPKNDQNILPVSPKTVINDNDFESKWCSFAIFNEKNTPKSSRHNQTTNQNTSNFETFDFRISPFDPNVIENGINPNMRETM